MSVFPQQLVGMLRVDSLSRKQTTACVLRTDRKLTECHMTILCVGSDLSECFTPFLCVDNEMSECSTSFPCFANNNLEGCATKHGNKTPKKGETLPKNISHGRASMDLKTPALRPGEYL